jgi:predicted phage terminase large subunit-like protein
VSLPLDSLRAAVDRELVARKGFAEFVRRAWPQVEPAPLVWGRHLDAVCEHLEAWRRGDFDDLVINIPPGCSKSLTVSTLFPAWVWIDDPSWRWIAAGYNRDLCYRDARRHRELIGGDWWAARWPEVGIPSGGADSKSVGYFFNTRGGSRYSDSVGGAFTGQHGDGHLYDDPHDPSGVASAAELDRTLTWNRETMPTRFRDPQRPRRILVMQRLHERDMTTEMKREGATVLCLPMRFERAHPNRSPKDWRTNDGELLVPDRYTAEALAKLEKKLGPRATAAQLQQRPAPAGGSIIKETWIRYWVELPPGGSWGLSVDAAFKGKSTSDPVCIQAWYTAGPNHYLVDQDLGQWSFVETLEHLLAMCVRYPDALMKLVEDKANGPAILSVLETKVSGLVPVNPGSDSKEARLASVEPLFAAGNVFFPEPDKARMPDGRRGAPWVPACVHEVITFPAAAHDDQVDALSQYLNHVAKSGVAMLEAAMANMKNFFGVSPRVVGAPAPIAPPPTEPKPCTEAELDAILDPSPAEVHAIRVRPHSIDPVALDALEQTLRDLPGAAATLLRDATGARAVDADGCVTVQTSREGWVRFALERQGYVREVLPARAVPIRAPADAGRGWR